MWTTARPKRPQASKTFRNRTARIPPRLSLPYKLRGIRENTTDSRSLFLLPVKGRGVLQQCVAHEQLISEAGHVVQDELVENPGHSHEHGPEPLYEEDKQTDVDGKDILKIKLPAFSTYDRAPLFVVKRAMKNRIQGHTQHTLKPNATTAVPGQLLGPNQDVDTPTGPSLRRPQQKNKIKSK